MILDAVQKKIIEGKPMGSYLVKGGFGTGKTTSALYRAVFLKNNYCLYEDDAILFILSDDNLKSEVLDRYASIEEDCKFNYITLFSSIKERLSFNTMNELVDCYFKIYGTSGDRALAQVSSFEREAVINQCILEHKQRYKYSKILNKDYCQFFLNEIKWMKCCNFTSLDEYQRAERVGIKSSEHKGPKKVSKNSAIRAMIYDLFLLYNNKLTEKKLMDEEDKILKTLNGIKASFGATCFYTHIIVDDSEKFSKLQLDLIEAINSCKPYSSIMYLVNKERYCNPFAWFIKGRNNRSYGLNLSKRSYLLSKEYIYKYEDKYAKKVEELVAEPKEVNSQFMIKDVKQGNTSVESFQYFDLRYRKNFDFMRDSISSKEIIVNYENGFNEYKSEELREIPVYNDIAAGEPITINSEQESNFYLPQYWIKGMKDCFILKVRGDSMINANIYDGDYVVIRKQNTAEHNDIVAVDINGSATLKRLNIRKHSVLLMPENEKYSPIPIMEEGAAILGTAVGIIKNKN